MGVALLAFLRLSDVLFQGRVAPLSWLQWLLLCLLFSLAILVYPIWIARRREMQFLHWPGIKQCVIEGAIAVPILVGLLIVTGIAGYAAERFSSENSMTPDSWRR